MKAFKSFLGVLAVLLVYESTAQSGLGIRAGINMATVSEFKDDLGQTIDPKNIIGMNFAAFYELGISDLLSLQPEINFLQKGSEVNAVSIEGIPSVDVKVILNYLEVPVLAKFRFGSEKIQGFALLGPSVGYAMSGKGTVSIHGTELTEKIDFDNDINDDGMKDQRWDFSAVVGAGGALAAGPGNVILDVRYGWDFTDFTEFKDAKPAGYTESYNRGLGITAGYQIPLSKK